MVPWGWIGVCSPHATMLSPVCVPAEVDRERHQVAMHKHLRLRRVVDTSQDVSVPQRFILIPATDVELLQNHPHQSSLASNIARRGLVPNSQSS